MNGAGTRALIIVAGIAGIGGMSAAIALRRSGAAVDPSWRVYAAGITITGPTLRHAEGASERYGIPTAELLFEVGVRRMVGGQEDMIADIALDMLRERDAASAGSAA